MLQGRTLTFTPAPTVTREAMTKTLVLGRPGFAHYFDYHTRPIFKFSLSVEPLVRSEAECLSALHALHQGGRSFFWDGGRYGGLTDYVPIGVGDSARREFFLYNRYVSAGSISVRTVRPSTGASSVRVSGTSLSPNPGVIYLATAPASGDSVQAKWGCYYRVHFPPDGFKLDQVAKDLYRAELTLQENLTLLIDDPIIPRITFYTQALDAKKIATPRVTLRLLDPWRVQIRAATQKVATLATATVAAAVATQVSIAAVTRKTAALTRPFMTRRLSATLKATPVISRLNQLKRTLSAQLAHILGMTRTTTTAGAVTQKAVPGKTIKKATISTLKIFARTVAAQKIAIPTMSAVGPAGTLVHGIATVPASSGFVVITGLPSSVGITSVPRWNTTVYVTSRTGTTGAVNFGTSPTTGSFLDWSVIQ